MNFSTGSPTAMTTPRRTRNAPAPSFWTPASTACARMDVAAALLSGDRMTFDALRCEAPELRQLPVATYAWFEKNYLDRDYPLRFVLRCNGVQFPDTLKKEP